MKKEEMLLAINEIDEKFIAEAAPNEAAPKQSKHYGRNRLAIVAACLCAFAAALGLILFLPYDTSPPDVSEYADSEYYEIIQKINALNYQKPAYKNNWERLCAELSDLVMSQDKSAEDSEAPSDGSSIEDANYQETTDNQTAGVIEADLIKRSDKYIYYLDGMCLKVYSIQGEASELIGSHFFNYMDDTVFFYSDEWEFFLSSDCKTITVLAPCSQKERGACVAVISVDVSDPANMTEIQTVLLTGSYLSARLTDGKLLLLNEFRVDGADFSAEESFLPQIDAGNGFESIPAEDIVAPKTLTSARYTIVCKFDAASLALEDCSAFLSYSDTVYVSEQNVYVTRSFSEESTEGEYVFQTAMTEISWLSYTGEDLTLQGSTVVAGYVKDQYSLDEHDSMLRVVTTTRVAKSEKRGDEGNIVYDIATIDDTNASLYCIDLDSQQIAAQVTKFAPEGEVVRSVRFDGETAYVCTSVELRDPVFCFDLSDPDNITYKHTGTIDGYSTSLVNFGNGYLLGIGIGVSGNRTESVKLEIYEETENGVSSVCKYELPGASYSSDYKSYLIDRENQLVGLGFSMGSAQYTDGSYLLLSFDGYRLHEVATVPLAGDNSRKRAVYIDGYLYAFGPNNFLVVPVLQNDGEAAE
ncbi:MAG: beta-propeller domain-containing protein [Lachnospiraceae bacterium]|nr:beta-propeller domain-containing protein [Lachnospiraceae bacterium]